LEEAAEIRLSFPAAMRPLLCVLLLGLAGCTTATVAPDDRVTFAKPGDGEVAKVRRNDLVGTWYGRQPTKEGSIKEWITRREIDGTFHIRFREWKDSQLADESAEFGEWGLSYDLEVVITRGWIEAGQFRPAPPDAYFWDIYRIIQLAGDDLEYVHQGTGHRYHVKRVPDAFEFPAAAPATEPKN
jgi:hypothetical protein